MKVTLKKLNSLHACKDGIEWFKSYKGNKELIPLIEKLLEVNICWANWLITHYMTEEQCEKYMTNPKIYADAFADAFADAYAYANAYAFAFANAYANASADAYADAYADAHKKKLTEIVKWGIEILCDIAKEETK